MLYKKFAVELGRVVREKATIIVEAKSQKDLEAKLGEVYDAYHGKWSEDIEWGCNESDSHYIIGESKTKKKAVIKLD